jgi:exoribonuclease R
MLFVLICGDGISILTLSPTQALLERPPPDPCGAVRQDLTRLRCYAVDDAETVEVDDALSIEVEEMEEGEHV